MKPSDDMVDKIALMMIEKEQHLKLTPLEFAFKCIIIYKTTELVLSYLPEPEEVKEVKQYGNTKSSTKSNTSTQTSSTIRKYNTPKTNQRRC